MPESGDPDLAVSYHPCMAFPENIHLFCRVVDNFGDIGVCWRLARQLVADHQTGVTLWVDDLASFQKICSGIDPQAVQQRQEGVVVRRWDASFGQPRAADVADVVIEAFGCALPHSYIAAMAARSPKPVWINLEYLSAESWIEDCHAMQSLYPSLPLVKYFFFPGFSARTGGLMRENGLLERRSAFQNDPPAMSSFLTGIGAQVPMPACRMSLFCYPDAPAGSLFDTLQADPRPSVCFVPQGVAQEAVHTFLQQPAEAGARATRGGLTVQVLPFLDQPDYDRLLWSCDVNFVRGEDSLVRAQWAARPFVWHIYPQEEAAHHVKLDALLDRYTAGMDQDTAQAARAAWQAWNRRSDMGKCWGQFRNQLPRLASHMAHWTEQLKQYSDLASNLIQFIRKIG
ncbi:MAG: elongation factor maturation arginine rhamnosyltransferase EarP [Herminiimonas sp.]|nr:elongation factor maturation arginine rhamnosyltransferase EarP [Herminiimonas sp.]